MSKREGVAKAKLAGRTWCLSHSIGFLDFRPTVLIVPPFRANRRPQSRRRQSSTEFLDRAPTLIAHFQFNFAGRTRQPDQRGRKNLRSLFPIRPRSRRKLPSVRASFGVFHQAISSAVFPSRGEQQ